MTQQEFTARTGYTPKTEDEFCKNWKRIHAPEYRQPCVMNFATEAETEQKVIELTMNNCIFRVTGRTQICVY